MKRSWSQGTGGGWCHAEASKESNVVRTDERAAYNLNIRAALAVVRARRSQDRRKVSRARRIGLEAMNAA